MADAVCHLLAEDPDLAEALPPDQREQALRDCTAPELKLDQGPWASPEVRHGTGIGMLVLQGLLIRRVNIEGRFGVELLGESDVVRPWQLEDAPMLPLDSGWMVLDAARVAVLDDSFTRILTAYPELAVRLFERAIRRSRHLVVNMAIIHQARVDERLRMLFWLLAGRWGRVRGDGVVVPLRLTHAVLADLVAARRPTVTTALSELSKRGVLSSEDDGWLLSGTPPKDLAGLTTPRAGVGHS